MQENRAIVEEDVLEVAPVESRMREGIRHCSYLKAPLAMN